MTKRVLVVGGALRSFFIYLFFIFRKTVSEALSCCIRLLSLLTQHPHCHVTSVSPPLTLDGLSNMGSNKSWPDLPNDIISLIMGLLHYSDQIRFLQACKSWNEYGFGNTYNLPVMFVFSQGGSYLYDPYHMQRYSIENHNIFGENNLPKKGIVISKYGWMLLISKSGRPNPVFYSPFAVKTIKLPALNREVLRKINKCNKAVATFTASPASPDCMVFIICMLKDDAYHRLGYVERICISTWRPGDRTWTMQTFGNCIYGDVTGVAYMKGAFYCTFSKGVFVAFHTSETREFKRRVILFPPSLEVGSWSSSLGKHRGSNYHLIECDEELLMVYNEGDSRLIFRFDFKKNWWLKVESLGNKSLLIDQTSVLVLEGFPTSVPPLPGNGIDSSRSYFPGSIIWIQPHTLSKSKFRSKSKISLISKMALFAVGFFILVCISLFISVPVLVIVMEMENAVAHWRALIGPTDAHKAKITHPHSIRAMCGLDSEYNCVHGSDSPLSAQREISFFFKEMSIDKVVTTHDEL